MNKYIIVVNTHPKYGMFDLYKKSNDYRVVKIIHFMTYDQIVEDADYAFSEDEITKFIDEGIFQNNPSIRMFAIPFAEFIRQNESE